MTIQEETKSNNFKGLWTEIHYTIRLYVIGVVSSLQVKQYQDLQHCIQTEKRLYFIHVQYDWKYS